LKECLHLDDVIKALPQEVPDSSKTQPTPFDVNPGGQPGGGH